MLALEYDGAIYQCRNYQNQIIRSGDYPLHLNLQTLLHNIRVINGIFKFYCLLQMRIVSDGIITPTGIAIDWYTDKIYWTDGETNRIEVISIEQKYRKVLFWTEVDLARAIALVPKEG